MVLASISGALTYARLSYLCQRRSKQHDDPTAFSYPILSCDFFKNFSEEPEKLTTIFIHPDVVPFPGMGIGKKGLPGQKKTPELVDYLKVPSHSISVGWYYTRLCITTEFEYHRLTWPNAT